jgi:hypothetical protein
VITEIILIPRRVTTTMKYFTRGWTAGEYDDEAAEKMRSAYWNRIETLRPSMPGSVAELSTELILHDGLIDRIMWDCRKRCLELKIVCSAQPSGFLGLRFTYSDVEISHQIIELLAERARDRRTVILFDEIDRDDTLIWIHRMLFWPIGEISIWFKSLAISKTSRLDKKWDHVGCDPFMLIE